MPLLLIIPLLENIQYTVRANGVTYVKGIDVSHWQGEINWTKVYEAGYRFVFIKATEGVNFVDPNLEKNVEGAKKAGLLVGVYHFAHPESNKPEDEARFFLSVAGKYVKNGYLKPVLDLEKGCNLGSEKLTEWVLRWAKTIFVETGVEPIIYVNSYYATNCLENPVTKYDLWIAHWTYDPALQPNTGIWSKWKFWQYSDNGTVPGINGKVDLDLYNGNIEQLLGETINVNITKHLNALKKEYQALRENYDKLLIKVNILTILLYLTTALTITCLITIIYLILKIKKSKAKAMIP